MTALPTHDKNFTMMLIGSAVADCATMGMHWLSQDEISSKLHTLQPNSPMGAVFFEPPANVRYRREPGAFSPYGSFLYCCRTSLAEQGCVRPDAMAQKIHNHFKSIPDAPSIASAFVATRDDGAEWSACSQPNADYPHALLMVPTLVARFAGRHGLKKAVRTAAGVFQTHRIVHAGCGLLAALLERCALTKCSPATCLLYFNSHTGGSTLSETEGNLLSSVMTDALLSRIKDIHDIISMHPSLKGVDTSGSQWETAQVVARLLANELVVGGGGKEGSAAILLDNAPLSSAQRTFWMEAKQAANAVNRSPANLTDVSMIDACNLFGTGSSTTSECIEPKAKCYCSIPVI